jgi:polygalacturonase
VRRLLPRAAAALALAALLLQPWRVTLGSNTPHAARQREAGSRQRDAGNRERVGWDSLPSILARIKPPQFPARDFRITDYGAVGGGSFDNTEAIRKAIEACHRAGGASASPPRTSSSATAR